MSDLSAFSLEGKRIAITGANTGIGQGIAVAVARAGGAVVGIGRSAMDETAGLIKAEGGDFVPVRADISDTKASVAMLNDLMAEGPLGDEFFVVCELYNELMPVDVEVVTELSALVVVLSEAFVVDSELFNELMPVDVEVVSELSALVVVLSEVFVVDSELFNELMPLDVEVDSEVFNVLAYTAAS